MPEYSEKDIDKVKQALPIWPQLRRQWADYDRAAGADQIAGEILKLTAGMKHILERRSRPDHKYALRGHCGVTPHLIRANACCRAVRGICKFLDQVELEKQIRQLSRKADRYRAALAQDPGQYLKDAAEWIARKTAEFAEQERRNKAERERLKKMRGDDAPEEADDA